MKHVRGFLFSLAFLALAFLAFNPQAVLKIQSRLGLSIETSPEKISKVKSRVSPPVLPETRRPNPSALPRIAAINNHPKNDPWIGIAPCSLDIFNPPASLPGLGSRQPGPVLDRPIKAHDTYIIKDEPTFLYKSENGVTLKVVQPVFEYYDVSGRRFRDAQNDIFDRQPLRKMRKKDSASAETADGDKTFRTTTLADIYSPTSLSYTLTGSLNRYQNMTHKTVLTTAYLITLPRWTSYETARPSDKAKWDDLFCNAAHHELGHLRIRLDILAETLDGYASLPPAASSDEMESLIIDFRKDISERVQARQDAYHIYNGGGTRRGMTELPYAELPFPWLSDGEVKTAEQSPE